MPRLHSLLLLSQLSLPPMARKRKTPHDTTSETDTQELGKSALIHHTVRKQKKICVAVEAPKLLHADLKTTPTRELEKILPVPFSDNFVGWTKSGKKMTKTVAKKWPTPPNQLPVITDNDRLMLFIKADDPTPEQLHKMGPGGVGAWLIRNSKGNSMDSLPCEELRQLEADGLSPWLAIQLAHIIPIPLLDELLHRWDHLPPSISVFGACLARGHADSLQKGIKNLPKCGAVLRSMDKMLQFLTNWIVDKVENALNEIISEHARLQDRKVLRAHAEHLLRKEFAHHPSLNFGGLFFTVAIKEGAKVHTDFCTGKCGDFCIPQLDIHIPLGPGSVLTVRTRLLAHCATLVGKGCQVVFTCFTDTYLEAILKGRDYAYLA
ncbi:hypothetical protein B0H16DRAFT_1806516 [Mycena metata]|uniref:Uncharacterized protein n=1 Tax=Mycena metata TaxID=1033252 RepID=A0AAD7MFM6_9AGAR|nr:hypothetical protein B0H16DRAFT_1806516 [Mycena metata]